MRRPHPASGILASCSVLLLSAGVPRATPQPRLQRKLSLGRSIEIADVAFSSNSQVLYVATSRGLLLKETRTGKSLPSFWMPRGWSSLNHIQVSPNGRYLAVTAERKDEHRLFVWHLKTKRLLKALDIPRAGTMAFSPDGRYLAVSEYDGVDPTICLLESRRWTVRKHLRCKGEVPVRHLDFSSNSKRLVGTSFYDDAASGDLEVWNPGTGKLLHYYKGMPEGPLYFLPGNSRLAFGHAVVNASTGAREDRVSKQRIGDSVAGDAIHAASHTIRREEMDGEGWLEQRNRGSGTVGYWPQKASRTVASAFRGCSELLLFQR